MSDFKLDRSIHWAGSLKDQEKHNTKLWKNKSLEERIKSAWYITCMSYGLDPENPPKMNKNIFSMRKHPK